MVRTALKVLPFLFLTIVMFYYPQEVISSALMGLSLWVNYILPAIFPFLIISEILMKQGFVNFLGALMEPLMRPLFRLPGKASFVLAMTHTSGIPIGAVLTSRLRKEGELTKIEGERLLAFTCNPSPGYMFGAVASGMMGKPALGIIIAGSIYIANLIVGVLFRFYGKQKKDDGKYSFSLRNAWLELKMAQKKNKKPIGEILADSVRESTSTILLVGGFIVFFAVIIHLLSVLNITLFLSNMLSLMSFHLLSPEGAKSLIDGFLETTIGCKEAIAAFPNLNHQVAMLTLLMGWGGISVFAQVASFSSATDIKLLPFIIGRTLHAFLALVISQLLLLFTDIPTTTIPISLLEGKRLWLLSLRWSCLYFVISILIIILIIFFFRILRRSKTLS